MNGACGIHLSDGSWKNVSQPPWMVNSLSLCFLSVCLPFPLPPLCLCFLTCWNRVSLGSAAGLWTSSCSVAASYLKTSMLDDGHCIRPFTWVPEIKLGLSHFNSKCSVVLSLAVPRIPSILAFYRRVYTTLYKLSYGCLQQKDTD